MAQSPLYPGQGVEPSRLPGRPVRLLICDAARNKQYGTVLASTRTNPTIRNGLTPLTEMARKMDLQQALCAGILYPLRPGGSITDSAQDRLRLQGY